jgi:hypothetical protein
MDIKKLLRDIVTFNFTDLKKRWDKLKRLMRRQFLYSKKNKPKPQDIPVIINNRDRYRYLKQVIERCEEIGFSNIIILDNDSTYPQLLEYYKTIRHKVIRTGRNGGPRAIWNNPETKPYLSNYYIYTDPDVLPDSAVSLSCVEDMLHTLEANKGLEKIGLGLHIDDLPDHFELKQEVISWEKQFHEAVVNERYFKAPVDTTFALYAPYQIGGGECAAYRTRAPYLAKHLPWYENTAQPHEEDIYYREHAKPADSHWTQRMNER